MSDSEIFRPRTTLKLHRLSKRKWGKSDDEAMLSSDSDEEDENCFDMDNGIKRTDLNYSFSFFA